MRRPRRRPQHPRSRRRRCGAGAAAIWCAVQSAVAATTEEARVVATGGTGGVALIDRDDRGRGRRGQGSKDQHYCRGDPLVGRGGRCPALLRPRLRCSGGRGRAQRRSRSCPRRPRSRPRPPDGGARRSVGEHSHSVFRVSVFFLILSKYYFFGKTPDRRLTFSDAKVGKFCSSNKNNLAHPDEAWICVEPPSAR